VSEHVGENTLTGEGRHHTSKSGKETETRRKQHRKRKEKEAA
jgi:hypothetical protein